MSSNVRLAVLEHWRLNHNATPAGAAYDPHAFSSSTHRLAARATIGHAARPAAPPHDVTPAPNAYNAAAVSTLLGSHVENSMLRGVPRAVIGTGPRGASVSLGAGADRPQTPGIGSYNVGAAFTALSGSHHAAAYSMPHARASPGGAGGGGGNASNALVGPASYQNDRDYLLSTRPMAARTRIGSASREQRPPALSVPGPAAYETFDLNTSVGRNNVTRPRSAHAVFSHAPRLFSESTGGGDGSALSKGPAAYEPRTSLGQVRPSSARVIFARASRDGSGSPQRPASASGPAPNAYDAAGADLAHSSRHALAPRARIGYAQRGGTTASAAAASMTPGPDSYYVLDLATSPTAPRARIGNAQRSRSAARQSAGPAAADYDAAAADLAHSSHHPLSPRARIGAAGRFAGESGVATPGPASYVAQAVRRNIGGVIGSSGRAHNGTSTPGPAQYATEAVTLVYTKHARTVIGSAARFRAHEGRATPGPASYEEAKVRMLPRSPAFTMRAR